MSNMKRFFSVNRYFSLCFWAYDYEVKTFDTEEEAQNSLQATIEAARAEPDGLGKVGELVWGETRGMVGEDGQLTPVPPDPDPEAERLRAELGALQAELEAVREAWAEVRGLAFTFVESEPYGNEAASVVISTMDAMMPKWASKALTPPPAAPAPKPPYVTPPSPTPAPPQWRWEKEEEYQNGAWRVRGTMTHLPSGVSDTSNWWLETGDAQAEAEQGVRNKLARRCS